MAFLGHLIAAQGSSGVAPAPKAPRQPTWPPPHVDNTDDKAYNVRLEMEPKLENREAGTYDKFSEAIICTLVSDASDGPHSALMGRWYKVGNIAGSPVFRQD